MVYHSVNTPWTVGQKKSLEFYYNTEFMIQGSPAGRVNEIATSLKPIGPTILVEWENETSIC